MNLYFDKALRLIYHHVLSNRLIYQIRRRKLTIDDSLPTEDEALDIIRSLRPPLVQSSIPDRCEWPDKPLVDVSVIVPCYNSEAYLKECLLSALNQDCSCTVEVLAINDGSTDSTSLILEELARAYGNLRVVNQSNKGFSGARNTGIELSRGRYICFLDSDDLLTEGAIESLYRTLSQSDADFVTGLYTLIDEKGRTLPMGRQHPHGTVWGRMFSREVWRRLSFPERFWFEDTVFAYMIAPEYSETFCDCSVYRYRKHRDAITATSRDSKRAVDTFFVTEEMIKWRRDRQLELDSSLLIQTLKQLGPLLLARTTKLSEYERKCLFVAASSLLSSIDEFEKMSAGGGAWDDLLDSLRNKQYRLWLLAASTL